MDGDANASKRLLPTLLPAQTATLSESVESSRRKRTRISAACEGCRARKIKCNGKRPTCGECVLRDASCRYTDTETRQVRKKYNDLRDQSDFNEELINLIKTLPESDSIDALRRLRAGHTPQAIVSQYKDSNPIMQLSVQPETQFRYEFPYSSEMPASLFHNNPYLDSTIFEAVFGSSQQIGRDSRDKVTRETYQSPFLKPYHAAEVIDPLLDQVTVSDWTTVISDDQMLRRLLSAYFLSHHPWAFPFHKDCFLQDMAAGRTELCSALLVNAVLAVACHICREIPSRSHYWVPKTLGYQFIAEAKRLWEVEAACAAKLTTIQANLVLSAEMMINAMGEISNKHFSQALKMAEDLELLSLAANMRIQSASVRKARIHTAWGLYSWQSWHDFRSSQPPIIREPPEMPLPDPATDSEWYGEIWLRYPLDQCLHPMHLAYITKTYVELRHIMNNVSFQLYGKNDSQADHKAYIELKAQLDQLYNLPEPLKPAKIVLPDHIKIHVEYHNIFRVLLQNQETSTSIPSLRFAADTALNDLRVATQSRIETLLRIYYLRHGFEHYDPMLVPCLVRLAHDVLETLDTGGEKSEITPSERISLYSTLILCAKGLHSQGQNFYCATAQYRDLCNHVKPDILDLLRVHVTADVV